MSIKVINGNCLEMLDQLPEQSVNTCVTSPPYWGLRDYGTATWEGGDENCDHVDLVRLEERERQKKSMVAVGEQIDGSTRTRIHDLEIGSQFQYLNVCKKCGATREDKQIGLEDSPEEYVESMVAVFREVKRVLRDDGTVWLNLGDSYIGGGRGHYSQEGTIQQAHIGAGVKYGKPTGTLKGLKPKDLVGIPWRVAFALQADGWYLRQDIIWHKPNPMPESVTDRCTKSHEYIFLLSKNAKYYYNNEAIKEDAVRYGSIPKGKKYSSELANENIFAKHTRETLNEKPVAEKRNKRSVWTVTTKPFKGAHFATFPPDLIEPCVLAGCPENGTVLDPFGGAGTTGLVAQQHNRNAVLIELNPEYAEMSRKRIYNDDPLFVDVE